MKNWEQYAANPMADLHAKAQATGQTYAQVLLAQQKALDTSWLAKGKAPKVRKASPSRVAPVAQETFDFDDLAEALAYHGC
jgi:hypothetical protein